LAQRIALLEERQREGERERSAANAGDAAEPEGARPVVTRVGE
ncbi:MAG: hypothetical protein QOK04_409, partial [Solirubrobacteraceae bacterium]|nr:hypothetical protein [Solirubrobacteraceae bacterium]